MIQSLPILHLAILLVSVSIQLGQMIGTLKSDFILNTILDSKGFDAKTLSYFICES